MLERLWTAILELLSQFVIPDWGVLIGLLPVGLFILIVVVLLRTIRMLRSAPPARRGLQRVPPRTPATVHMPGPSFAPFFAAFGVFLLFLGLVFGGTILLLGAIALVLTLLYWLAEGLRVYDHDVEPTATVLPAVVSDGPPPGVHMPGPSYRPFLGAFGVFLLMLGLVFGGPLLFVGVIALAWTLLGWLTDARQEYVKTVQAEQTGHLENIPPPRSPRRTLTVLGVLVVAAAVIQSGVFNAGEANGGTAGASPSAAPAAGGGGSAAPPASGGPPASVPPADVNVVAKGIAFVTTSWTGPAGKAFTIAFDNEDAGTPHNLALIDSTGQQVFKGEPFNGVAIKVYDVPALDAGTYKFVCTIHANMTGEATLQ
jgi:plastocyanin